jgi:hypothetical protein
LAIAANSYGAAWRRLLLGVMHALSDPRHVVSASGGDGLSVMIPQ